MSRARYSAPRRRHPAKSDARRRHRYAPFGQRTQRLRLSRVAALFPSKGINTRPEVLAGLKLRPLEKREKVRPNRIWRGSPEQRRRAIQSPKQAWRAVSEGRMGGAKPFENTTFSAPRWAHVRVRNRDDGGGNESSKISAQGRVVMRWQNSTRALVSERLLIVFSWLRPFGVSHSRGADRRMEPLPSLNQTQCAQFRN